VGYLRLKYLIRLSMDAKVNELATNQGVPLLF